jgi:hypothetical protein
MASVDAVHNSRQIGDLDTATEDSHLSSHAGQDGSLQQRITVSQHHTESRSDLPQRQAAATLSTDS